MIIPLVLDDEDGTVVLFTKALLNRGTEGCVVRVARLDNVTRVCLLRGGWSPLVGASTATVSMERVGASGCIVASLAPFLLCGGDVRSISSLLTIYEGNEEDEEQICVTASDSSTISSEPLC